jgi:hypothetical protein
VYYYKVAAVNSYGTSGMSNEASATPIGNEHAGSYSLKATMTSTATYSNCAQVVSCSANTTYTGSVWIKGSGDVELDIKNGNWGSDIKTIQCVANGSWQQISVPSFSSGSDTQLTYILQDQYGVAGAAYLDDCFLGVSGGTNLLANPGFESGNNNWGITNSTVWAIGKW